MTATLPWTHGHQPRHRTAVTATRAQRHPWDGTHWHRCTPGTAQSGTHQLSGPPSDPQHHRAPQLGDAPMWLLGCAPPGTPKAPPAVHLHPAVCLTPAPPASAHPRCWHCPRAIHRHTIPAQLITSDTAVIPCTSRPPSSTNFCHPGHCQYPVLCLPTITSVIFPPKILPLPPALLPGVQGSSPSVPG